MVVFFSKDEAVADPHPAPRNSTAKGILTSPWLGTQRKSMEGKKIMVQF